VAKNQAELEADLTMEQVKHGHDVALASHQAAIAPPPPKPKNGGTL
jgi:hypothetical protein